ncbi:monovalent cation/H(+) antiporter subunit G [Oceanirhabdus seepicola]|uniref:Monovalent cation/H(+) antiporter subunit G n=1 Tax=Oceanirhabdus seepicola TaxID=2828781 RepID=A0A9J6PCM9_9CLOT|nr:monovalent cation/H(+) antiporter subunit G [Oceanirhabdus seepicola]MCM1992685.1 monovalent cation/H(+) antiporter subunit G [Oceanirhabdus seepicola]
MIRILIDVCLILGIFFVFAGVVGIIRMPDTYCRLQSSTNIVTMGGIFLLLAAIIFGIGSGKIDIAVKAFVILVFIILTNPVASHAMARAAYKSGAEMDKKTVCDEYKGDKCDD